jgi:drug/metabolite transporter (DMT)-like permease
VRLATDAVLAGALAVALLVLSPGVAMAAIIALLVLLLCAVSFGVDSLVVRRRARRRSP